MTDPTQQGFVDPPRDELAQLSLGETASLALKAARGAGYSWGESEDIGSAIRWLTSRDIPGPEALVRELKTLDGEIEQFRPHLDRSRWLCHAKAHSPLQLGIALTDHMTEGATFDLGSVRNPVLLVPFLNLAAEDLELRLLLSGSVGFQVTFDRGSVSSQHWKTVQDSAFEKAMSLQAGVGAVGRELKVVSKRQVIDPDTLTVLQDFAQRTYAPETEESRVRGAGSEQSDID